MSNSARLPNDMENLFSSERIRTAKLGDTTLYSLLDLLGQISHEPDPTGLWDDLKRWEPLLARLPRMVRIQSPEGVWSDVEMVDVEQALRVVESIPSPKAERIKRFLAEAGRQRIEESDNPELIVRRMRSLYDHRGYSKEWIDKRLHSTSSRHELTGQWYKRGATQGEHFRDLTNGLMAGLFGMDVESYKRHKGLRSENLRDHMNDLELALTVLGETTAAILHKDRDSQGVEDLQRDIADAGRIAGQTRQELERELGRPVASSQVHLPGLRKRRAG